MAITYRRTNTNSDFTGGADFSKAISGTDATGSQSFTVANSSTEDSFAWTESGVPGTGGATGNYTVELEVTTGSTSIYCAVLVSRVNSSGTVQSSSSATAEQQCTAGTKTFSLSSINLGTWASGDRLRVTYRFRSANAHGGAAGITISHGGANNEVVTPFSGTTYNETGRSVSIASTVSATDAIVIIYNETGRSVSISSTVSETDTAVFSDAGVPSDGYYDLDGGTGSRVYATDTNLAGPTGDLELILEADWDSWRPTTQSWAPLITKHEGSQLEYLFQIRQSTGNTTHLRLEIYNSSNSLLWAASSSIFDPSSWGRKFLRVVLDVDDGASGRTADFYHSDDGSSWTHINQTTASGTITPGNHTTADTRLMGTTYANQVDAIGKLYSAKIYYGGTLVASPDFTTDDESTGDSQGVPWVDGGAGAVYVSPVAGTGPVISIASTITSTDSLGAAAYDETGRQVSITSTVAVTDTAVRADTANVSIASTTTASDSRIMTEALSLSLATTVTATEGLSWTEPLQVSVASTITETDVFTGVNAVNVSISSTITATDGRVMPEATSISIISTITSTDAVPLYEGVQVSITSTITITDAPAFTEARLVQITSSVVAVDGLFWNEPTTILATSNFVSTDILEALETKSLSIASTISVTEGLTWTEARSVSISSTVTATDDLQVGGTTYNENVAIAIASTLSLVDARIMTESRAFTIVSTISEADGRVLPENRTLSLASTVSGTDSTVRADSLGIIVNSTLLATSIAIFSDLPQITIIGFVSVYDWLDVPYVPVIPYVVEQGRSQRMLRGGRTYSTI